MPIISGPTIAAMRAKIDSEFGPIPTDLLGPEQAQLDTYRNGLAAVVAEAALYVKANGVVNPGSMQAGGDPVSGAGTIS